VVVFLESGSLVGPDWLDHLLDALDVHPRNGLAGPSTNRAWSLQGAFSHASGTQRDIDATAREAAARYGRRWRSLAPLYCLADFCYVVRREVIEAVGGADEGYSLGPCWEMDYTIRAVRAGFQAVWAQGAYVYRYPFTARRDHDEKAWFARNKRRYQDKFCGLRLTRQREGYADHCRGEACPHFAPPSLVQVQLTLSTKQEFPPIEDSAGPPPSDLPLITCIMPTCNRRDWAKQAVSYFLRQDYPHRELVIVDDGQQDLAGELPSDPRIRYLRPISKLSIGEKRNKGCEVARGQIIAHWDDDDWYAPDRLTRQIEPILSGAADITALFNTCFFDLDRWTFWRCSPEQYRRLFVLDVHGGTLVFRRDVFGRLARYPHHSLAEDAAFLSQAVRRGARLVRVSGADLYLYVRHGANTWTLGIGEAGGNSHWARVSEPLGFASDRGFYEIRFAARRSVHPAIGTAAATA
jgi:GT2 family glycosyltransferase